MADLTCHACHDFKAHKPDWKEDMKKETVSYSIKLENHSGQEIDLCPKKLRNYLSFSDEELEAGFLLENMDKYFDYQEGNLSWHGDGSVTYYLHLSEDKNFKNELTFSTNEETINIGILIPGRTYYWKVTSDKGETSEVDWFITRNEPLRNLIVEGVSNIRDVGGYSAGGGKRVRYGMMYRSGRLDCLTEKGKYRMKEELGIKTELDLRNSYDDYGQRSCAFGEELKYVKIPMYVYSYIMPQFKQPFPGTRMFDPNSVKSIKSIFEVVSVEENYPICFHCNVGADRTGTLAFLINGLLGVDFKDLTKDFETTSFSPSGRRWRSNIVDGHFTENGIMQDDSGNFVTWNEMYNLMMDNYAEGGSLSHAIENYLKIACGVSQEAINSVKRIMLEDYNG